MFGNDGVPECGDFKRGACFRATCKFLHGGKPGNEGGGIPGSVNGGSAGLPGPRPAGQFEISDEDRNAMDLNLYDPNTGFGLFGTSAFGTRWGQTGPMVKCDNVRPLCMDFFKNGVCNRRGPHNQGCLFRHDEIERTLSLSLTLSLTLTLALTLTLTLTLALTLTEGTISSATATRCHPRSSG